jgi:hypothetical protein
MTALTFLWEYKFYIACFVLGGLLVGGSAWKIQGVRLDNAKATLAVCTDANAENDRAITAMKAEIEKGNKTCEQRLASKDSTIKRLKQIDNLRGIHETNHATGNDLRDALNGMWNADSKGAVR